MKARSSPEADENLSVASPSPRRRMRWLPWVVGLAMLAVVLGLGGQWLAHRFAYVSEIDARVAADTVILSPTVAGRIVEMPAGEGAVLAQGDAVLRIDDREARLRADELRARLAGVEVDRARLAAEIELVEQQTRARTESEEARLRAAKALAQSLSVQRQYADTELARAERLVAAGTMPRRDLDRIRSTALQAAQESHRAEAQAATAVAELGAARAARQRLAVLDQEVALLTHKSGELRAALERAEIEVANHVLRAPVGGVVSRTFVTAGEFVSPGQRVALLHDPDAVYVEALIKETDVGRLRVGQTVALHVDAYPDDIFTGEVARIGHAATSEFSLLPNPNPSGNFTKVTQRLPVKIAVRQVEGRLRPGMMVEVDIDVR
ncbi:MAG: HlyD family secretion protein [Alphaproteobacteria bacterium]